MGGGLWLPDAQTVAKLRASIDERPARWRRVLVDDAFRRIFLPTAKSGDEESCLKAFCKSNEGNALKTKPKVCQAKNARGFQASNNRASRNSSSQEPRALMHVLDSGLRS